MVSCFGAVYDIMTLLYDIIAILLYEHRDFPLCFWISFVFCFSVFNGRREESKGRSKTLFGLVFILLIILIIMCDAGGSCSHTPSLWPNLHDGGSPAGAPCYQQLQTQSRKPQNQQGAETRPVRNWRENWFHSISVWGDTHTHTQAHIYRHTHTHDVLLKHQIFWNVDWYIDQLNQCIFDRVSDLMVKLWRWCSPLCSITSSSTTLVDQLMSFWSFFSWSTV